MNKAQPLIQKSFDWREFDKSPKSGFKFFLIKSVSRINFSIEGFFISFAKLGEIKKWVVKDRMKIIPFVLFNFLLFRFPSRGTSVGRDSTEIFDGSFWAVVKTGEKAFIVSAASIILPILTIN